MLSLETVEWEKVLYDYYEKSIIIDPTHLDIVVMSLVCTLSSNTFSLCSSIMYTYLKRENSLNKILNHNFGV